MPTQDVLEFLSAIISRHGRLSPNAEADIVPFLIHDLESHRALVDAAIRDAGGVYLQAEHCASGVVGQLASELAAVVHTALRVPKAGGGLSSVTLEARGNQVRALLDSTSGEAGSGKGVATLLGVSACLFSSDLSGAGLVVVSYDESVLDREWKRAVFQLFSRQLPGCNLGTVRTLVVLVEAPSASHILHCEPPISVVGRVGPGGFERRKDWAATRPEILRLAGGDDHPMVLFLGAGFSASSGLPLGNDLRDDALARLLNSSDPFAKQCDTFVRWLDSHDRFLESERGGHRPDFVNSLTLERVLREELFVHRNRPGDSPTLQELANRSIEAARAPGPAARALGDLIEAGRRLVVVTVNFDALAELTGRVKVFASEEEFKTCAAYLSDFLNDAGDVPVLKLHGTIERAETIVVNIDQYAQGLGVAKASTLRGLLSPNRPRRWIYVGYSMRDPDVSTVLGSQEFAQGSDETWVSPFPATTARAFVREHRDFNGLPDFWQRSITETADVFLEELAKAWST